jgi:3-oxoacyl-[acyl-carrier protein] reductase
VSGVVVVTGAAGGLGRVYCRHLADAGWTVVAADLEGTDVDGAALSVATDVTSRASTEVVAAATVDAFGRIDALVNNAGYYTSIVKKPFEELSDDEWDRCFAVNVRGAWLCARAVAPTMKAQLSGKIVNTSSMTVPSGIPGFLHYVASKSAIVGLTRALARELGEWNVCVNTITPDYVPHDEEYAARQPEMAPLLAAQRAFKRDAVPEDLVGTLLHLVGHGSDFVTGQEFWVNGGRLFG